MRFPASIPTRTTALRIPAFAAALVAMLLIALLIVTPVFHNHISANDADHCPLCVVMHSAAPVLAAVVIGAATLRRAKVAALAVHRPVTPTHSRLYSRPPPQC